MREFGRISDEENRSVVEYPIQVPLFSPKLDRKSTGIACGIGRSRLPSHCGEANCRTNLFANSLEKRLRRYVTKIMGSFEVTMSSSSFSMDL